MSSPMRWGAPPPRGGGWGGGGGGSYNIFGLFVPKPIAWLIALALFMSAGASVLGQLGVPLLDYTLLETRRVWRGEIWRLLTWSVIDLRPLGLIFGCVALYFFGSDLARRWGTRRFFATYFGGAVITAVVTCLIAKLLPAVSLFPHMGLWPMQEAMIIAWAVLNPGAKVLVYFVLPISSRHMIGITIAATVIFAALSSFYAFVPHFVAEALALVYLDVFSFRRLYLRGRMAMLQRDYKRRTAHIHVVDRDRDEPPRWTH